MENASKALLIAAAVLITILLISLSIFIVQSASESANASKNSMTELEINSFNYKFKSYEGKRKSSSQVNQLLKTIASSNSLNDNKIVVKLSGSGFIYDSSSYVIFDENDTLIKCNASNVVSLDEIINFVNSHKAYNYTVSFYYCNQKTQSILNNKHLNPITGCILLIYISKN